jgi:carbamate kinase
MSKLAVIALGGNALLRVDQEGTIDQQEQNTKETLENIVFLLQQGYNIVITHGNGPQVGNIVMRNDAGEQLYGIPQMPLDICVADSQGGIGYMIERMLYNVLKKHNINRNVLSLMTMVEVDPNDTAFNDPRKRIGKILAKDEADKLNETKGWKFKKESKSKNGYRRVVPSPKPKLIMNREVIARNALSGTIVIAVGGGGIPVYYDEEGNVRAAEAVIDKDLASSMLAHQIGADELYILTDVPFVYANYGSQDQQVLEFLNYADTMMHLESGAFGEGTMAPKIKAALQFIREGGYMSIITESKRLADKSYGTKITMDYNEKDLHKYDN